MLNLRKFACVAACLALAAGTVRAAEEKKVGVVNIAHVFNDYAKIKDIQEHLKKDFEARQAKMEEEERALKFMVQKIQTDGGEEGDPKTFRAKLDLEQRKFDYSVSMKKLLTEIEERRKIEMKSVLEEIKSAISKVGRMKRFDLILRAPEFDEFDPTHASAQPAEDKAKSARELVERFRENPVLYFAEGVDITSDVKDILNADYKARGGK